MLVPVRAVPRALPIKESSLTTVTFRSPTDADIESIARRMRSADVMECAAASGRSPRTALEHAVSTSQGSFTAVFDGEPEAIFGYAYRGGLGAEVWMLGTDELRQHPRILVEETRRIIAGWTDEFPVMHNFVDDSNVVAKRWLKSVGFTMAGTTTTSYGVAGVPFRYFWCTASV